MAMYTHRAFYSARKGVESASYFCFLSYLICKPQSHMFGAGSRVKSICFDGRVVSTSDSESVGPASILGGRKSNLFLFFFLLEVIFFSLHVKVE